MIEREWTDAEIRADMHAHRDRWDAIHREAARTNWREYSHMFCCEGGALLHVNACRARWGLPPLEPPL